MIGKGWKVVNLDRMEYLDPSSLNESGQLAEQKGKTALALYLLTITPIGYGGIDGLKGNANSAIGLWCGDRVAVISNETQDGDIPGVHGAGSIFGKCVKRTALSPFSGSRVSTGQRGEFKNITGYIRSALIDNVGLLKIDEPDTIMFNGKEYRAR